MIASKATKKRGPFLMLVSAVMSSSAIMIYCFWRYSLKTLIVTFALLCLFLLFVRVARAIDTESLAPLD